MPSSSQIHLPPTFVAEAGGWKGTATLERCYQQAQLSDMLRVVTAAGEIREAQG